MQFPLSRGLGPLGSTIHLASAAFSPTSIAGLKLWLKADSLSLSDGDPVSTWADSSGTGNTVTASGAAQPTYKSAIVGGKPVVRFDGSSNSLSNPSPSGLPIQGAARTVCFAAEQGSYSRFLYAWHGGGDYAMAYESNGPFRTYAEGYYGTGATITLGTWLLFTATLSGTTLHHYRSGTEDPESPLTIVTPAGTPLGPLTVGSLGGSGVWLGDLAEILVYDSVLSGTDRGNVETYLQAKYGL